MPVVGAGMTFALNEAAIGAPNTTAIVHATVTRAKVMMFSFEKMCFMVEGAGGSRT